MPTGLVRLVVLTVVCLEIMACSQEEPKANPPGETVSPSTESLSAFGPLAISLDRKALLVGCTSYPLDKGIPPLVGPGNDVELLAHVLVEKLDFPPEGVVRLTESAGQEDLRPTRANIQRAFATLAEWARPGDQVLISLGGHGFQMPNASSPDPDDVEPDGLDETFCPADIVRDQRGNILNMIVDDELRDWIGKISEKGAAVCLIVDACHSGTVLRAPEEEVPRRLDAWELGLAQTLENARQLAGQPTGPKGTSAEQGDDNWDDLQNVTAISAAQSYEQEIELPFTSPLSGQSKKPYGLFTYTLCQVLETASSARPLTYRDLVERVRLQYIRMGRSAPTPSVEGQNADAEAFGIQDWPRQERFLLRPSATGTWELSAGSLHGMTPGSILAVYAADDDESPLGHILVEQADVLASRVSPYAFDGGQAKQLKAAMYFAQPVLVKYDDLRLELLPESVDAQDPNLRKAVAEDVLKTLKSLAEGNLSWIEIVREPSPHSWRVRIEGGQFFLVPPEGQLSGAQVQSPNFGPAPLDELELKLKSWLTRIARVEMLKRLASPPASEAARAFGQRNLEVKVAIVRHESAEDRTGAIVKPGSSGLTLEEGEIISFEVTNPSAETAVYVTLLLLDADYGVASVYPAPGQTAERLPPGTSFRTDRFTVKPGSVGLEHLLIIALEAKGPPVDFTALEQPAIEEAREISYRQKGNAEDPLDSPLGRLFQSSLYGQGESRSLTLEEIQAHMIDLVTWRTRSRSGH